MKHSYKAAISLIIIITALSVGYISWKQKKETLKDDPVETKGVLKEVRVRNDMRIMNFPMGCIYTRAGSGLAFLFL